MGGCINTRSTLQRRSLFETNIVTKNYSNLCLLISNSFLFFQREHDRSSEQIDIDVFADFWSVAILPSNSPQIGLIFNNEEYKFTGPVCFFIPAHSIVKWRLPQGHLSWFGIMSTKNIHTPYREPMALSSEEIPELFRNEEDVARWIGRAKPLQQIGLCTAKNIIAEKTKAFIDNHFQAHFHLTQISDPLGVSGAYLTKEFKKEFGITPQEYKNKKRVYKAMQRFMFSKFSASQMAYEVGFNDYSRFAKNFLQALSANPIEFKSKPVESLFRPPEA
jgi:AraC-like DNA-binding protein